MADKIFKPELLCPAGDTEALLGAIAGGADAVYLGADLFNARIRANNFTLDGVADATRLCHAYGVKVYVTLNIAIHERELGTVLEYVSSLYQSGVDALIVSDLGVMREIRKHFPDFELHASTQCTVHNSDGARFLSQRGCKRVVVARELDKGNMEHICATAGCEIEAFVHGAHCMSVSGQCLMSYAMGGRSGNRGECAQPCRLPYKICGKSGYHLSLKDMSLSEHIRELSKMGVSSLKIEGRMKSADYVYGVSRVFRSLLDGQRAPTDREKSTLASLFSRQGFSDGYFVKSIDRNMLGIRSEEDKAESREISGKEITLPKIKLDIEAVFRVGEPAKMTVTAKGRSATAYGDTVEMAVNAPMSEESIVKSLVKLGNTPYEAGRVSVEKDENIIVRVSSLNALRRECVSKLLDTSREKRDAIYTASYNRYKRDVMRTAVFSKWEQIPEDVSYFDRVYLYLDRYKRGCGANGIYMPPVILDSEWDEIEGMLRRAMDDGVKYAMATNIGQIDRLKAMGFTVSADYRFNVFNRPCVDYLRDEGIDTAVISPELTLPQARELAGNSIIVYGNIPVMTTHKCVIKDTAGCDRCRAYMTDRTGASFLCEGIYGHRNVIYNSVPIYMADKMDTVRDFSHHFIFTGETREQVEGIIEAYKKGMPTDRKIKRIK